MYLEKLKAQQHEETTNADERASSPSALSEQPTGSVEAEQLWLRDMEAKYGEGTYQLFRSLYKDLCDEIRREYYTKPPPPFPVEQGRGHATRERPRSTFVEDAGATPSEASPIAWSVVYQPANNCVVFRRDAVPSARQGRIVAYSKVEAADPPRLNALLTFADWCPIEVFIERRGVIMHISVACNEGGMHMRNVRVYRSPNEVNKLGEEDGESSNGNVREGAQDGGGRGEKKTSRRTVSSGERDRNTPRRNRQQQKRQTPECKTPANVLDITDDAEWCRQNLCYDGPCLWHLEMDFLNELYDVMQDHGISLDWVRWVSEWVHYLEHVNYTWWSVGMLEELVPTPQRGPESDFLTEAEREALDEPAEDWLSPRTI